MSAVYGTQKSCGTVTTETEKNEKGGQTMKILKCFEDEAGHLHCWCPDCKRFHHHGHGEGIRTSHCDHNSDYKIEAFTKKDFEMQKTGGDVDGRKNSLKSGT